MEIPALVDNILRPPVNRDACLSIFAYSIRSADSYGSNLWGIALEENSIVLVMGNTAVSALWDSSVWLGLYAPEGTDLGYLAAKGSWTPTPDEDDPDLPMYSGLFRPTGSYRVMWGTLRTLHGQFIGALTETYTTLYKPYREAHSDAFLKWLDKKVRRKVPRPDYGD